MKRKIFVYVLTLCLIVACSFALTACSNKHNISIKQNDYLNISTNVYTAKSEEKVTISYTKKENFVEKPGYELKFMVETNDHKTIVVNYDESGNYYFIMPDCDVSISAEYLPIQYTITYDLNGGENNANNPTTYTVDSNDIIISQPVRYCFYFSGWTINDDSQIVRNYTIPSGTTGNITLKANWRIHVYYYNNYKDNYKHRENPTYTGEELSVNASDFVYYERLVQFVEISGDTKATNAGTYEVTLSLKDKVNYCWYDETTEDKTATWEIVKAKLSVRSSYEYYSGEEISVTSENFFAYNKHANLVDITGTTSATNAGTYNVTLSLKDKANTIWSDETTEDKTVQWRIFPARVYLYKPINNVLATKNYTGNVITVTPADFTDLENSNLFTISGTASATNVGTYNVTLSLKENYCWEDGTIEDKNVTWEIVKAKLTVTRYTFRYTGEELTITSADLISEKSYADFVTVSGQTSATEPGTYTVTLSLNDKINMTWSDGTTDDKTVKWKIERLDWKNNVAVSTLIKKIYTGEEITVTSADFILAEEYADYITISGQTSGTEKGTYTVTISLADKENMTWADDTTEDKTVQWIIAD